MVAYMKAEQEEDDILTATDSVSGKDGKDHSSDTSSEKEHSSPVAPIEHSYKAEVIAQIRLAFPVCCTFLMRKSVDIVSVMFVGRLGSHYLSAAGIAAVTSNVLGNSMIVGLAGALSTLCSQAFGSKDMVSFNIAPQRAVLILAVFICAPVSVLWWFSSPVMVALGQSQQLADAASKYLIVLIPSMWALSFSICIQNWLHAQSKTRAIAIITFVVAILHPFWCWCYIFYFRFGYLGAALAVTTSKFSEFLMLIMYIYFFAIGKETDFQFTSDCFSGWGPFLCLGFPNMLMMGEWWASEAIIFMAGSLAYPESQVSAMSIYQNTLSICFMIPSSFHVAASTRVGNSLGAAQPELAKMAAYVSPTLALGGTLLTSFGIFISRSRWAYLFTNDIIVVDIVVSILPVLVMYVVTDGVQSALTGVLKGLGKQRIAGPVVLFAYYVIGLPLSYLLAFPFGLGVIGLCIGTTVGTFVHMLLYLLIVARTNWTKESNTVQYVLKREAFKRKYPTATFIGDNGSDNGSDNEEDENWKARIFRYLSVIGLSNQNEKLILTKKENKEFKNSENSKNENRNSGTNGNNGSNNGGNRNNENNGSSNNKDSGVSMYRKVATFFGIKTSQSSYDEYELVQSCTDSLKADLESDIKYYEGNEEKETVISYFSSNSQ